MSVIRDLVESRLPALCDQQKSGEAAWFLFLVISIKIVVSSRSLKGYFDEDNPVIALLIADAVSVGLVSGPVNFSRWNKSLTNEGLDGSMWLYAYETTLKGPNKSTKTSRVLHKYYGRPYEKKIVRKLHFAKNSALHFFVSVGTIIDPERRPLAGAFLKLHAEDQRRRRALSYSSRALRTRIPAQTRVADQIPLACSAFLYSHGGVSAHCGPCLWTIQAAAG
jgi:hypothetical protein